MPTDETKFTIKVGLIASFMSALIVFILSALWVHQTDITLLKANQAHVLKTLEKLETVPNTITAIDAKLSYLAISLEKHDNNGKPIKVK